MFKPGDVIRSKKTGFVYVVVGNVWGRGKDWVSVFGLGQRRGARGHTDGRRYAKIGQNYKEKSNA